MSEHELWLLFLAIASVVVVVVALLLGLVIAVLRDIDRQAAKTHTAGKQIAQNTVALWTLEQTNRDLVAIRDAARGVERALSARGAGTALSGLKDKVQGWLGSSDDADDDEAST